MFCSTSLMLLTCSMKDRQVKSCHDIILHSVTYVASPKVFSNIYSKAVCVGDDDICPFVCVECNLTLKRALQTPLC